MHPYLQRLGVHPAVQQFFRPYYNVDVRANLTFDYGDDREAYGLAWHKVPATDSLWFAGPQNLRLTRHSFICSSAMEAIAWLHYHHQMAGNLDQLSFIATGNSLSASKLSRLRQILTGKRCSLIFGDDVLGKVCDLKIAAALRAQPVTIRHDIDRIKVEFRAARYLMEADRFSICAFEKQSAFRFNISTLKPKGALTWLDRLTADAFNP